MALPEPAVLNPPLESGRSHRALRRSFTVGELQLAGALAGTCAVLSVLGFGVFHFGVPSTFDPDGERNVPALWSGALLFVAAAATWQARSVAGPSATGLAVLFTFMGLDEVAGIHELLERLSGIDWQQLYLPLVLLGGWGWLKMLRAIWPVDPTLAAIWVGGAVAWTVAQCFEFWEWNGDVSRPNYYAKVYPEEFLEMFGSACWLLVMVVFIGAMRRSRPG